MSDSAEEVKRNFDLMIRAAHERADDAIRRIPLSYSPEIRTDMESFFRKIAEDQERALRLIEKVAERDTRE